MKKTILILFGCLAMTAATMAQEAELTPMEQLEQRTGTLENAVKTLQKIKVSGYIQTQFQYGEKDASLKVGGKNENPDESFNRIGIRRGRLKFTYDESWASAVFELDMTEKGVGIKDAYLRVSDPWLGVASLKAGVFDRPFGHEIAYSSSRLESPERSRICNALFPDEKDLGASLTLQAPATSPLNFLKLEAGLFAGNAIGQELDNRKDFIGHLSGEKNIGDMLIGGGVSYYNGGVYQGTTELYKMSGKGFVLNSDDDNKGKFAKREYFGLDAQYSILSVWGMTQLRGEYLFGTQPGSSTDSSSPKALTALPSSNTYLRNFQGAYLILVQDLATLPLSAVLKYDFYDPNSKIAGNELGLNGTGVGDVSYQTFGFGLLWRATNSVRVQAFYELNKNETSANLAGYDKDRKDNVFTLRLQYKF